MATSINLSKKRANPVSVYPLDKNRKLLKEERDVDGTIRKTFRIFSEEGDWIDIELEEHLPQPYVRPVDVEWKIISQERDEEGYLHKLVMAKEGGALKEYYIDEKLPSSRSETSTGKRKAESEGETSSATQTMKKQRSEVKHTPSSSSSSASSSFLSKFEKDEVSLALSQTTEISSRNLMQLLLQKEGEERGERRKYAPSRDLLTLLAGTKAESLKPGRPKMITLTKNETLSSAFRKLTENDILSAPVMNEDGTWFGFLEILDIVTWFVNQVGEREAAQEGKDLMTILEFNTTKVREIMTYPVGKRNRFRPFPPDSSLLSVCEELARGTRRVPIVDKNNTLHAVVTQSMVVDFIKQNITALGEKKHMPVRDIYLSSQYVLTVLAEEVTIEAFRLMKIANVTGIAITDDAGAIIGNISASDIKRVGQGAQNLRSLFLPVSSFMRSSSVISVSPLDTLESVLRTLSNQRVHRVYVTVSNVPQGVLSLTDILKELVTAAEIESQ